jgi:hypothetical protein
VSRYVRDSLSDNTRRAYLSDLRHFEAWGAAIPSTDVTLADYLAAYAGIRELPALWNFSCRSKTKRE